MLRRSLKFLCSRHLLPPTLPVNPTPIVNTVRNLHMGIQRSFAKSKAKEHLNLDRNNKFFKDFRSTHLLDDLQIFKFFRNSSFFQYMNENFRVLPFLIDQKKLIKFHDSFETNQRFQQHIMNWFHHSQQERFLLSKDFPLSKAMSLKRATTLRPFIELYLEFLQENYPKELEISVSLSTKTEKDLRMPHEWYPQTRKMKRKIIYHHGPTNSGKTFSALEHLEQAEKGIYCAPLRLLAWEIFERLEAKGIPCDLITGQEKIIRENSGHVSCTVETSNLGHVYDVAVIDEIQMIGNDERGSAWTNALLALQAPVIHLCGEGRALSLVSRLCHITGDTLEERKYERYSKVFVENKTFRVEDLDEGDCIITFSRRNVHQMKNLINEINQDMHSSCALIYGKLPPEVRKEQARKFNDPTTNCKYLIATNAIGMGVNLKIRRIIFQSLTRTGPDGEPVQIDYNEIRQIAGRAGRYTENGYVTCMKERDLRVVRHALKGVNANVRKDVTYKGAVEIRTIVHKIDDDEIEIEKEEEFIVTEEVEIEKDLEIIEGDTDTNGLTEVSDRIFSAEEQTITKAGIFPHFQLIESFSKELELFEKNKSSLSSLFRKFVSIAQIEDNYFIQRYDDFCLIADMLEKSQLNLKDQYIFSSAPLNLKFPKAKKCLKEFADNFGKYNQVKLPEMLNQDHPIFNKKSYTNEDLNILEEMHHILDLYIWLGQKYSQAFEEKERATVKKDLICDLIDKILDEVKPIRNPYY